MTTPNNPTPPPGYRLLTRDECRSSSKRGTVVFNFVDQSWAERDFHCEPMDKSLFYAIPITHPATGDAKLVEQRQELDLSRLIRSIPCDVRKHVSYHDLKRIVENYNA